MPKLTPVDFNPFEQADFSNVESNFISTEVPRAPKGAVVLTPVDFDPFSAPDFSNVKTKVTQTEGDGFDPQAISRRRVRPGDSRHVSRPVSPENAASAADLLASSMTYNDAAPSDPALRFEVEASHGKNPDAEGQGTAGSPYVPFSASRFDQAYRSAPVGAWIVNPSGKAIQREPTVSERIATPFASMADRTMSLARNSVKAADTLIGKDIIETGMRTLGENAGKSYESDMGGPRQFDTLDRLAKYLGNTRRGTTGAAMRNASELGLDPNFSDVKADPLSGDTLQFLANQVAGSVPDMTGALALPEAYVPALMQESGEARARNDGRADATTEDVLTTLPTSLAQLGLERFGVKVGLPGGTTGANAASRILKAGVAGSASEGLENLLQYGGETIGTERGASAPEAIDQILAGMLVGAPMSGGLRGATELANGGVDSSTEGLNYTAENSKDLDAKLAAMLELSQRGEVLDSQAKIIEADRKAKAASQPELNTPPAVDQATPAPSVADAMAAAAQPPPPQIPDAALDELDRLLTASQEAPAAADPFEGIVPVDPADASSSTPAAAEPAAVLKDAPSERVSAAAGVEAIQPKDRLAELRTKRAAGPLAPDESAELVDLLETDAKTARLQGSGQRMPGLLTMEGHEADPRPRKAFVDLDNFKSINDTIGHAAGDDVIVEFGRVLRDVFGDGVVRHKGGDEFVAYGDNDADLAGKMEKVRSIMETSAISGTAADGRKVTIPGVGLSFGTGGTINDAETRLQADKRARLDAGKRTERRADDRREPPVAPAVAGENRSNGEAVGREAVRDEAQADRAGAGQEVTPAPTAAAPVADKARESAPPAAADSPAPVEAKAEPSAKDAAPSETAPASVAPEPVTKEAPAAKESPAPAAAAEVETPDAKSDGEKPPRLTGTKNAVTDSERAAANRNPILRDAVQTNEATLVEAMRTVKEDSSAGPQVVARLAREGVAGISLADEAVLLVHKTDLINQRESATKKLADPDASDAIKDVARQDWAEAEAKIAELDQAAVNSGREWGRLGQFRQRMLKEDFTFAAMERKERARLERPLTLEESAKVKAMADTIAEQQARLEKLQARLENASSEGLYEFMANRIARPKKRRPTVEYLRKAANDARARLAAVPDVPSRRGQSGAVISPIALADYAVIGAYHIANGAAKFADWVGAMSADLGDKFDAFKAQHPAIFSAARKELEKPMREVSTVGAVLETIDPENLTNRDVYRLAEAHVQAGVRGEAAVMSAVHASLGEIFDGITEREVRRMFTDYGHATFPSQEEAKVELRQLRALVQMQESIDRISEGLAPLRSGPQRDAMTQTVREKRAQLNEVLKTLAKDAKSPAQMRSYNDMRVRNLTNQIEDLTKQIATGERPAPKGKAVPSAEVQALVAQRDALVRERDAVDVGGKRNESEKASLRKRIAAIEDKLRGKVIGPKDPVQRVDDKEMTELRGKLETLRERRDRIGREAAAREGLGERITELMQRLAGKEKAAKPAATPDSPEVAELKRIRDELASELRELERVPVDLEERYQKARGNQIQKRIAELRERIAAGDFEATPKRVPRALSEANSLAQFELAKAKEEFLRYQFIENLKKRSPLGKIFGAVGDVFNLSRAIMTSLDLSGVLRQGGMITLAHPGRAAKSIIPMLKAFASEKAEHKIKTDIESRANAPLYKRYGLQLTGIGAGPLTQIEEAYASRWLDKLPAIVGGGLVRGSGRSYTAFLNKLRADSFDAMAASLGRAGELTEAEGKAIANYINVATGRGKIGTSENAGQALNTVFFAPRLVASRFQLLAGQPMYGGTGRTRKLIAQEYARFMIGAGVTMALAAFAFGGGDDEDKDKPMIGFDPRSSNFLKVRFGKTYLDPMAGLSQVSVLAGRLATGETVTGNGDVRPIRTGYTLTDLRRALGEDIPAHEYAKDGGLPFGGNSATGVIGKFLQSKLAPVPGAILNVLSGEDYLGEKITPAQAAGQMVTPMSVGNVLDVMEEQGVARGTGITLLGLLGMGVQHREESEEKQFADFNAKLKDVQTEVKERLAAMPVEQWSDALEAMKKERGPAMEGIELEFYKEDGKYGLAGEPKRDADGNPKLTSNRIADDYRKGYRDSLIASGMFPDDADAAMKDHQVHHIIPDNLARHHPLMAAARDQGYDLDELGNLLNMPADAKDGEIAHHTAHPEYDAVVFSALNAAEKRLKKEHGSLKDAPKAEVLDAVRKIEADMREKIKARSVPVKDGRLAIEPAKAKNAA